MAALESPQIAVPAHRLAGARRWVLRFLAVLGPGVVVAFADTEAGSITTAATSGAQYGYALILLQLLLIVPLFVVQEMTVRLGVVTGKGHARLIREHYGLGWTWLSLGTMLVTNVAALVTEFAGIAGAAQIFGLPSGPIVIAAALAIVLVIFTASYKRAEMFAFALCLVELLFIPAAFAAHAPLHDVVRLGIFGHQPLHDYNYLLLIASNIGAVIMPWMIFYQQSATVDKGLKVPDLNFARIDTALGAVSTQAIMCAVVVMTAATLFVKHIAVSDAAHAAISLEPLVGHLAGVTFGAALIGASMLGAFVVSLATAWAFGEAFGWRCSLNDGLRAKRFTALYVACVAIAAGFVLIPRLPLIAITVYVEAFNGFVLPIVLGFLLVLVNDKRVIGDRRNSALGNIITVSLSAVVVVLGLWMAFTVIAHPGAAKAVAVLLRAAVILALASVLCACAAVQSESFKGTALRGAQAPDITLTDDTGSRWTLASQRGTAIALFFGYTHCLDTCPLTLAKLAEAVRRQKAPAKFAIAFVTVDPRRDTPAVLHRYVRRFSGAHIVGLTGTEDQIARVERSYGVWAQSIPGAHGRAAGYDEAHSSVTYLIDPSGRERVLHNDGDSAADFAADLGMLAQ